MPDSRRERVVRAYQGWADKIPTEGCTDMDSPSATSSNRYQILIVDDLPEIRKLLQNLLEHLGHDVMAVASGEQALRTLNEYSPDVIFSDISMDDMNGYQLVRHLRHRPDTQSRLIVAMTGDCYRFSEEDSLTAGFDAHLAKPFALDLIREVLTSFEAKIALSTEPHRSLARPLKKDTL